MAIEVATAYMPVVPSMRGLKRQLSATALPAATAVGSQMSTTMSSRISSGLKTGVKVGAAGIGAVLGTALVKGFGRLSAIENAEAKLTGLGNSASDTAKIMDNALVAVKGTAFGMDEAATTAASAVAAGVAPGQELEKYLGLVGDAATIAGTDMASMGSIFNKVMTSGKVQGDVFAQLSDSGIPVVQMLAEEMGVSAEQVYELGSKGEISSEQFLAAMGSMEGAAKEGGKTTTGAFKNMMAALSRFGAGMLKGIFPLIGPLFNGITASIDKAEAVVTPFAESVSTKLGGALKTAGEAAVRFVTPLKDIGNLDVLTPEIVSRMGLSEDSPMGRGMNALIGGIRAFRASWTAFDGDVTSSGFPGFMERAAFSIRSIWESLRNIDFSSWDSFKSSLGDSGSTIMEQFQSIGDSLVTLRPAISEFISSLPKIGGAVGTLAVAGIGLLADTLSFLANHVDTIIRFMPLIVAGFVAWKVASVGLAASQQRLLLAQTAMAPVMLANNALRLVNNILETQAARKTAATTVATAANTTATASNNVAQNTGIIARGRAVVATVAHKAATVAHTVATKAATIAQRALNLAMRMNPIGLVIMALVALGAAVVVMYNRVGWFKDGVQAAWAGIKLAVGAVASWFMTYVWPTITNVAQWIGDKFVWLWQNAVVPAFTWIREVIGGFVTWFTTVALPWVRNALTVMGQVFTWLWQNIVKPVWAGIRVAIAIAVGIVMTIIQGLVWFFRNVLGPVFTWLYNNVVKPVFKAIGMAISFAWNNVIKPIFQALGGFIKNVLGPVFQWLYNNIIKPVWGWIAGAIRNYWQNGIKPTFNALKQGVLWVGDKFSEFRVRVNNVWQRVKMLLYMGAVYIIKNVYNPMKQGISWVADRFAAIRDRIARVWSDLKLKLILGWQGIRASVFGPLKQGVSWVGDRFSSVRDRIGGIWSNLRARLYDGYVAIKDRTFGPLKQGASWVADRFSSVRDRIGAIWQNLREKLYNGYTSIRDKTFGPLKTGVDKVKDAFETAKDGIVTAWDALKDATKKPVEFFVNTVYNKGLRENVNKVLDKVGLKDKHLPEMSLPAGFARGGVLPGHQRRKKDDRLIPMRSGEGVLVPEVVKGIGPSAIHALNAAGNGGGVSAVREVWKDMAGGKPAGKQDAKHQAAGPGTRHFGSLSSYSSATLHKVAQLGELTVEGLGIPSRWGLNDAIRAWDSLNIIDVKAGKIGGGPAVLAKTASRPPFSTIPNWAGYWKASAYGGGATDGIWLNSGLRMPTQASTTVTTHEIGHALGLGHAHEGNGARSIMNYGNMYKHNSITSADVGALKSIYPNFVTGKSAKGGVGITTGSGSGMSILDILGDAWEKLTEKFDNAKKSITDKFSGNVFGDMTGGIAGQLASGVREKITSWIQDKIDAGGDTINNLLGRGDMNGRQKGVVSESQVSEWMTTALKKKGLFSEANLRSGINRARKESNLDPGAINRWDSNWLKGDPSKGLMQVVGSTFNRYKEPGYGDIWKGLDNILASINYTIATYGSLGAGWNRPRGYALGGIVDDKWDDPVGTVHSLRPGLSTIYNGTGTTEKFQRVEKSSSSNADFTRAIELLEQIANADRDITVEIGGKAVFEAQESYKRAARIR